MRITKDKLPRDLSYPLRSSRVIKALAARGITSDAAFSLTRTGALFSCHFWPPNPNVHYERLYITAAAVPSGQAAQARTQLEDEIIPAWLDWLAAILALPSDAVIRREQQLFTRS